MVAIAIFGNSRKSGGRLLPFFLISLLVHSCAFLLAWLYGSESQNIQYSRKARVVNIEVRLNNKALAQPRLSSKKATVAESRVPARALVGDPLPRNTTLVTEYSVMEPEKKYFSSSELDIRPTSLEPILLPTPQASAWETHAGQVILMIYIGADGLVEYVDIEKANVPDGLQLETRLSFIGKKMSPGIIGDRAVPSLLKVMVEYDVRSY